MSKNTDTVIRSMEASTIYNMGRSEGQIQRYLEKKNEYYDQKSKVEKLKASNVSQDEIELAVEKRDELEEESNALYEELLILNETNDFSLPKCSGQDKKSVSNISLSLMRLELQSVLKKKDKFTRDEKCSYTDVVINVVFKDDVFGMIDKFVVNAEGKYVRAGKKKTSIIDSKKLRSLIYKNGFWINGRHYIDFQRSSSKSRVGNDLFIIEDYADHMKAWMDLDLDFNIPVEYKTKKAPDKVKYEKVDLVGIRAYDSLASSSLIGTIDIDPQSILMIDDVCGKYTMLSNVVKSKPFQDANGRNSKRLIVEREKYTQYTDCFDGQSLVDESIFLNNSFYHNFNGNVQEESYGSKGFLLLRNRFFKSAGFNTKIQEFFKSDVARQYMTERVDEAGETYTVVKDKFGDEMDSRKVLVITTKNSVKIFKEPFRTAILRGKLELSKEEIADMSNLECERLIWKWYKEKITEERKSTSTFGICKYEKVSKFNDGEWQQTAYQINNSLNFTRDNIRGICYPMLHHMELMKNYTAFLKDKIDSRGSSDYRESMMLSLLAVNDKVAHTKMYDDFLKTQIQNMKNKLYKGKPIVENTDYCVIVGNPYEMLMQTIGGLDITMEGKHMVVGSIMDNPEHDRKKQFEVYSPKFRTKDGTGKDIEKEIYGFRNPHICESNSAYMVNVYHPEYEWFNFTDNIMAVSFTGYGAFLSPTLNGCDTDSDQVLVGDNPIILEKVIEAQEKLVPINNISEKPILLELTEENLAIVDAKLSNDFIGRIVNLAQVLQSCYWHIYNVGTEEQKLMLDGIFDDICILEVLSNVAIDSAKRKYDVSIAKELSRIKKRPYLTTVGEIIEDIAISEEIKIPRPSFSQGNLRRLNICKEVLENPKATDEQKKKAESDIEDILYKKVCIVKKPLFMSKLKPKQRQKNKKDMTDLEQMEREIYIQNDKERESKSFVQFETPMDYMVDIVSHYRVKNQNKIHGVKKADTMVDIIDILKVIPKGEKADYHRIENIITWTLHFGKMKQTTFQKIADGELTYEEMYSQRKIIDENAVNKFSKYKITENDIITLVKKAYDDHDKVRAEGKVDKIDKALSDKKLASQMLTWLYMAHRDTFLNAFRQNRGHSEFVREVDKDYKPHENETIHELYGKRYLIVAKEPLKEAV